MYNITILENRLLIRLECIRVVYDPSENVFSKIINKYRRKLPESKSVSL